MGIVGVWGYAMSCLSAYMALGIAWYLIDRSYGHHIYRWLYDLFHKESMPVDVVRGVMFNQPTNRKVTVAFALSTLQSLYMILSTEVNFLVELIMWLLEVPAMLVGFACGAWIYRFLVKRSVIFDRLDEFGESVKGGSATQLKEGLQNNAAQVGSTIASLPARIVGRMWDIVYPIPAPVDIPPTAKEEGPQASAADPSPQSNKSREALDRYTRRNQ